MDSLDFFKGWTPEMIEAVKCVGLGGRMEEIWANRTPEEKEEIRRRKSECWSNKTSEEMEEFSKGQSEASKKVWDSRTPEEREEVSEKQRIGQEARIRGLSSEEQEERLRRSFHSPEARRRASSTVREMPQGEKDLWNLKVSRGMKRYLSSLSLQEQEERLNNSFHSKEGKKNQKSFFANEPPESKKNRIERTFLSPEAKLRSRQSLSRPPSEPEIFLGMCLRRRFPGEWAYNGDGGQNVIIGGRIPDFVNISGMKAVIEVFGVYHHPPEDEAEKVAHYKKFGYECMVIWEYDCYLEEEVVVRVTELLRGGDGVRTIDALEVGG